MDYDENVPMSQFRCRYNGAGDWCLWTLCRDGGWRLTAFLKDVS